MPPDFSIPGKSQEQPDRGAVRISATRIDRKGPGSGAQSREVFPFDPGTQFLWMSAGGLSPKLSPDRMVHPAARIGSHVFAEVLPEEIESLIDMGDTRLVGREHQPPHL